MASFIVSTLEWFEHLSVLVIITVLTFYLFFSHEAQSKTLGYRPQKMAFLSERDPQTLNSLKQNLSKLDVVLIGWAHIKSAKADIAEDKPQQLVAIANSIHAQRPDVKVVLVLDNAWADGLNPETISTVLSDYKLRRKVIEYELAFLQRHHFDGINIDFERVPLKNRNDLSDFMEELTQALHPYNLSVSMDVNAESKSYDFKRLAASIDYEIVMFYDEHWRTSEPGPIASIPWFQQMLSSVIQEIPPEKLVLGLANYGYDWNEQTKKAVTITFKVALQRALSRQAHINLEPMALNPYFEYVDDNNNPHTVWFLDAVSLFNQCTIANSIQPYGYALWQLGHEDPSTWLVFENNAFDKATAFKIPDRNFEFDDQSGLIISANYEKQES